MKKFLIIALISVQGFAQGLFEVKTSSERVGINELLRVDFISHDDGLNFKAPSFEGFTVKEGPTTSQYETKENGKIKYNFAYSYLLQPQKKGTFTIGAATLEISEEPFKTQPVTVTVTDAVKNPRQQSLQPEIHPAFLETDDE